MSVNHDKVRPLEHPSLVSDRRVLRITLLRGGVCLVCRGLLSTRTTLTPKRQSQRVDVSLATKVPLRESLGIAGLCKGKEAERREVRRRLYTCYCILSASSDPSWRPQLARALTWERLWIAAIAG